MTWGRARLALTATLLGFAIGVPLLLWLPWHEGLSRPFIAAIEGFRAALASVGWVLVPQVVLAIAVGGAALQAVTHRVAGLPSAGAPRWIDPAVESALLLGMVGTLSGMVDGFVGLSPDELEPGPLVHGLGTALRSSLVGFSIALVGVWVRAETPPPSDEAVHVMPEPRPAVALAHAVEEAPVSAPRSPLGSGLYFLDVLACLLFAIVLALVGARFGSEQTVDLELPEIAAQNEPGSALADREIAIRETGAGLELWLDGEAVSLAELRTRLVAAPPPSIVVRSEASALSEIVGLAHEAGVEQIELAYETKRGGD